MRVYVAAASWADARKYYRAGFHTADFFEAYDTAQDETLNDPCDPPCRFIVYRFDPAKTPFCTPIDWQDI